MPSTAGAVLRPLLHPFRVVNHAAQEKISRAKVVKFALAFFAVVSLFLPIGTPAFVELCQSYDIMSKAFTYSRSLSELPRLTLKTAALVTAAVTHVFLFCQTYLHPALCTKVLAATGKLITDAAVGIGGTQLLFVGKLFIPAMLKTICNVSMVLFFVLEAEEALSDIVNGRSYNEKQAEELRLRTGVRLEAGVRYELSDEEFVACELKLYVSLLKIGSIALLALVPGANVLGAVTVVSLNFVSAYLDLCQECHNKREPAKTG